VYKTYSYQITNKSGETFTRTTTRDKNKSVYTDTNRKGEVIERTTIENIGKGNSLLTGEDYREVSDSKNSNVEVTPVSSPVSSSVIDNSKNVVSNTGVTFSRSLNPSETLAPPVTVDTSRLIIRNNQGTYTKAEELTGSAKLTNDLARESSSFKANFLTQTGNAPTGTQGLIQGTTSGAKVLGLAGASFGVGVVKGGAGTVKDIVSGEIITGTFDTATELVSNPKGVFNNLATGFKSNPPGFIGEQGAYIVTTQKIGKFALSGGPARVYKGYENKMFKSVGYDPLEGNVPTYRYPGVNLKKNVIVMSQEASFVQGSGFQSTLKGGVVTDAELINKGLKSPPPSALGLDSTPFYNDKFRNELNRGGVVKGSTARFDDVITTPEIKVPGTTTIKTPEYTITSPTEKILKASKIGETTDTRFYYMPVPYEAPLRTIYVPPKGFTQVRSKYIPKNSKLVIAEEVPEVKLEVVKDVSKQKKLNFDENNNFIGANIGFGQTGVIIGKEIYREFKPNIRNLGDSKTNIGEAKLVTVPRRRVIPFIKTGQGLEAVAVAKLRLVQENKLAQENKLVLENKLVEEAKLVQEGKLVAKRVLVFSPGLVSAQRTKTQQEFIPLTPILATPSLPSFKPPREEPNLKPKISLKYDKPVRNENFIAQVKKRGKFVNVGVFDTKEKAFGRAGFVVSNTASASLRVKKIGGGLVTPTGFINKNFRLSKSDSTVLVEKRGSRIKSAGEKAEISYKGILTQKNKKLFGGLRK
jgi:hypothetical protein